MSDLLLGRGGKCWGMFGGRLVARERIPSKQSCKKQSQLQLYVRRNLLLQEIILPHRHILQRGLKLANDRKHLSAQLVEFCVDSHILFIGVDAHYVCGVLHAFAEVTEFFDGCVEGYFFVQLVGVAEEFLAFVAGPEGAFWAPGVGEVVGFGEGAVAVVEDCADALVGVC